jgi:hypothetical protein
VKKKTPKAAEPKKRERAEISDAGSNRRWHAHKENRDHYECDE